MEEGLGPRDGTTCLVCLDKTLVDRLALKETGIGVCVVCDPFISEPVTVLCVPVVTSLTGFVADCVVGLLSLREVPLTAPSVGIVGLKLSAIFGVVTLIPVKVLMSNFLVIASFVMVVVPSVDKLAKLGTVGFGCETSSVSTVDESTTASPTVLPTVTPSADEP